MRVWDASARRSIRACARRDFADPGLAGQQHHLAFALLRLLEAVEQHAEFVLAADERREAGRATRREPALRPAVAEHPPRPNCPAKASQLVPAQIDQLEQAAKQALRRCRDHHAAWLGKSLETCRQIWSLADHGFLLRGARADQIADHHLPGRDADAYCQRLTIVGDQSPPGCAANPRRPWSNPRSIGAF
jgi:hypothetical protein